MTKTAILNRVGRNYSFMWRMKLVAMMAALWGISGNRALAQNNVGDTEDDYSRAHIAYSGFSVLGINTTQYARAVKCDNYLEPDKKHRRLLIEGEEYLDNGEGNDLVAHDGILTSVNIFSYPKGSVAVVPGQYREVGGGAILYDPGFLHTDRIESSRFKIKFGCKMKWIKCSSWPSHQEICRRLSWPFTGYFEIVECDIELEFF